MANNFSADNNCKAVWNLESGALTADSKGGNILTNSGVDEDLVNFKQGACSGLWVRANADYMTIADAALDSGFPLKSGEANKSFSFTFWVRFANAAFYQYLMNKSGGYGNRSLIIYLYGNKIQLEISANGIAWNSYIHASALSNNVWYHVGITYDAEDDSYRIRIWDDTAQAILGEDKVGTATDILVSTADLFLSLTGVNLGANLDEIAIFNDVLTADEIDQIRAGTYGAVVGTNMKVNIGGVLKDVTEVKQNIGGVLKDVTEVKQNIGGVLKDVFG